MTSRLFTAALLAAPLLALPAAAQTDAARLTYSQALSEQGVRAVQQQLRDAGAYAGRVDGVWGPDSQRALEQYQQRNGLQVTGQLNQATAATLGLEPARLLAERGSATGADAGAAAALSGVPGEAAVRRVQERLRALNFYDGNLDGLWGANTQAALQRFQQGRGLQATGQLNPATVQALGLDAANLAR